MNLRLTLAEIHTPRFIRTRELVGLVELTAGAFEAAPPALVGRSFDEKLDDYSRWTQEQATLITKDARLGAAVRARLRDRAFDLGSRLRISLGLRTRMDVLRGGRLLYRLLGIDFRGTEGGEIIFRRCFFSRNYSPETCSLLAALDEGVLAGLSGGGRLEFSARITEGSDACRARFVFPEHLA